MKTAGLDIGSRTIELVVVEDGQWVSSAQRDTSPALEADCRCLLSDCTYDRLVVTGYGRALAELHFEADSVTEIKAYARGAQSLCPGCRSILDIGGQDTKAVALDGKGRVLRFEMNDRCAAGAGRFLEMSAAALDLDMTEFGRVALRGDSETRLNSMCAVFAESEIVGLVTKGTPRESIARAVHDAIARRSAALLQHVSVVPPVVFAGGTAKNPCLVELLQAQLGLDITVPEHPEFVGALGAALIAAEKDHAIPQPAMSRH